MSQQTISPSVPFVFPVAQDKAVALVHRHLEYLKFVSGRTDKQKVSGQGIEIPIVVLPDLLLDIRQYNLIAGRAMTAVGGRAARVACALLHLLDDEDGTFQVHLLSKTGNLGRLLLEDEFHRRDKPERRFPAPFLEYLTTREGEPRCAIRSSPGAKVDSSPQVPDNELSVKDLMRPEVLRLLVSARAICLASINTPNFDEIFGFLCSDVTKGAGLFIDTRRADPDHFDRLLRALKNCAPSTLIRIAGIYVREEERAALIRAAGASSLEEVSADYQVPLITYGPAPSIDYIRRGANIISAPCQAKFQNEGIPECLKGGILLAWSTYETLRQLPPERAPLRDQLVPEWSQGQANEDDYWATVLAYAASLSEARDRTSRACDFRSLLAFATQASEEHLDSSAHQPRGFLRTAKRADGSLQMLLDDPTPVVVSRLAARRRTASLRCIDIGICPPDSKRCEEGCRRREDSIGVEPSAAVMIDLDGTLLDSSEQRERALAEALTELVGQQDEPVEMASERVSFFERNVYARYEFYVRELDLPDFRQQWNQPGWYAAFLVLHEDSALLGDYPEAPEEAAQANLRKEWATRFHEKYQATMASRKEEIGRAQRAFDRVRLYPFKEARDFLKSLTLAGLRLYIVSEGDPETQWAKIKNLGFDEFFDRERVLTTEDAAKPRKEIQAIERERAKLETEVSATQAKKTQVTEWWKHLDEVGRAMMSALRPNARTIDVVLQTERERILSEEDAIDERLAQLKEDLEVAEFVKKVIKRLGTKGGVVFYGAVVRAILLNPTAPRSELERFDHGSNRNQPSVKLKIAMIGDRQKNDIAPPTALMKNRLLTIRLLSSKYADELVPPETAPIFTTGTLAQAKAILLSKDSWDRIGCAGYPPIYNWKIDLTDTRHLPAENDYSIGIDYILRGCTMPRSSFPLITRICAGVLVEHLAACDERTQKVILSRYLGARGGDSRDRLTRAKVLCSIEMTGALYRSPLRAIQLQVVEQLAHDLMRLDLSRSEEEILQREITAALKSLELRGEEQTRTAAAKALEP